MSYVRKMIGVAHPYVPESHEKPLRAEIETLIWNNPESKAKPGEKVQYVVMGGMNINAVEVHPVLAMLTNHADTVVGVAHPDAPQSRIIPHESPFNDKKSFANSGYTVLRTIEKLYEEGAFDRQSPLTVIGFSTGGAVLTEAIAQDITEASVDNRARFIHQGALLSPGGMLEIGEKEILKGIGQSTKSYWQEFIDTQVNALKSLLKNPKKLADALTDSMSPGSLFEEIAHAVHIWKRMGKNIGDMRDWPKDTEWKKVSGAHKVFEVIENLLRVPRVQFVDELLAHFHRSWIDQPGWPHFSPETPAFKRSRENVAHDVTQSARKTIAETPMVLWFGQHDKAIQPTKFLTKEDQQAIIHASSVNKASELQNDRIVQRIREAFPKNGDNLHILFAQGERSHHLNPRSDASILELYLLRYLYPGKMPEVKTIFVGSSQ